MNTYTDDYLCAEIKRLSSLSNRLQIENDTLLCKVSKLASENQFLKEIIFTLEDELTKAIKQSQ